MPTGTGFAAIYPTVRALLGDRQVHGNWFYSQATLNDAIRAVFVLGRGPENYTLDTDDPAASSLIVPALTYGDAYALTCYEAGLILVQGEDGAGMLRTRAVWNQDKGDRKRALMDQLQLQIYNIRDGKSCFVSYQNLMQFLGIFQKDSDGMQAIACYIELDVVSRLPVITV